MKKYKAKVHFSFEGEITVNAENRNLAHEYLTKHVGMNTIRGIHSSLPDKDVDWEFKVHADKRILSLRQCKE